MCECEHLTNFAVLLDVTGVTDEISDEHLLTLTVITYAGCIISIVCLLLSFITFTCLKSVAAFTYHQSCTHGVTFLLTIVSRESANDSSREPLKKLCANFWATPDGESVVEIQINQPVFCKLLSWYLSKYTDGVLQKRCIGLRCAWKNIISLDSCQEWPAQ